MTTHNAGRVAGERIVDLAEAMQNVTIGPLDRGLITIRGTVGRPFVRAVMRVEAELLIADANALSGGASLDRTYGQRRADAVTLLLERLVANLPANAKPYRSAPAPGPRRF
jgi:hypothetical protein